MSYYILSGSSSDMTIGFAVTDNIDISMLPTDPFYTESRTAAAHTVSPQTIDFVSYGYFLKIDIWDNFRTGTNSIDELWLHYTADGVTSLGSRKFSDAWSSSDPVVGVGPQLVHSITYQVLFPDYGTVTLGNHHIWIRNQQYASNFLSVPELPNDSADQHIFGESPNSKGYASDYDIDALHSLLVEKVVSQTTTTPPSPPVEYARYIIPTGATGRWAGLTDHIAFAVADFETNSWKWIFRKPFGGEIAYVVEDNNWYWYNSATPAWEIAAFGGGSGVDNYQDLVDTTGPFDGTTDGYVPMFNFGSGNMELVDPATLPVPPHALGSHSDTQWTTGAGVDGYVVAWNQGLLKFTLVAVGGGTPHALGSHTDTVFTAVATGDIVYWDGTNWINRAPLLTDVISGGMGTTGQVLTTNGTVASFQNPAAAPAASQSLFGCALRHPLIVDQQSGNFGDATFNKFPNVDVVSARWSNPAGIMESTAGLGYGNIKIPASGYTQAIFFAKIRNISATAYTNFSLCVVKKNPRYGPSSPSPWLYVPFGLFGAADGLNTNANQFFSVVGVSPGYCWQWDDSGPPPTSGPVVFDSTYEARLISRPILGIATIQSTGYLFHSSALTVTPGTVYAIAAGWTGGGPNAGAGQSVTGGDGPAQPTHDIFDEWGVYLYA